MKEVLRNKISMPVRVFFFVVKKSNRDLVGQCTQNNEFNIYAEYFVINLCIRRNTDEKN